DVDGPQTLAREPRVKGTLAPGEAIRLPVGHRPSEEQRDGFLAGAADGEAPVVGPRRLGAQFLEERRPRRPMPYPAVDQHAIHVENARLSGHDANDRGPDVLGRVVRGWRESGGHIEAPADGKLPRRVPTYLSLYKGAST